MLPPPPHTIWPAQERGRLLDLNTTDGRSKLLRLAVVPPKRRHWVSLTPLSPPVRPTFTSGRDSAVSPQCRTANQQLPNPIPRSPSASYGEDASTFPSLYPLCARNGKRRISPKPLPPRNVSKPESGVPLLYSSIRLKVPLLLMSCRRNMPPSFPRAGPSPSSRPVTRAVR